MSRLTSAQFQQLIDSFQWSNFLKLITGDVMRQFIQNLKDSGAEALLKDGTSIQAAITELQNSIPEAGTGGATNELQLKLIGDIIDLGLTTDDTQFDYNRVMVALVKSLLTALDGKMDKTALTETFEAGPYKPNTPYVYNAAIPEYVSFSNPASDNPDFQVEAWYRLAANASATQTPETNPEIWIYNGRKLGNIIISDVLGLTEKLNELEENSGTGGGHVIQNDAGAALAQQAALQFKGVPVSNDAANGKTIVDVSSKTDKTTIEQAFVVRSTSDYGEVTCDIAFKIDTITPEPGLTVTAKTSAGADYVLGTNVAAFGKVLFYGNTVGKSFVVRGVMV